MQKYIYLYTGGGMPESEEEQQKVMDAWGAYYGKLGERLVDPGAPFGDRTSVGGAPSAATGYTIIQAADLDEAKALTDGHPHVAMGGGAIEIAHCIDMTQWASQHTTPPPLHPIWLPLSPAWPASIRHSQQARSHPALVPAIGELLRPTTLQEWHEWLAQHHADRPDIWLVYWPKASNVPFLPYADALDEALCWGWIDSVIKRLDDGTEARAQRWTPRRSRSNVSELNKAKVRKLVAAGRMQPAGIAALPGYEEWIDPGPLEVPNYIQAALHEAGAWDTFCSFPEDYQRLKVGWIVETRGRREERDRRLAHLVRMTAKGKMYGTLP